MFPHYLHKVHLCSILRVKRKKKYRNFDYALGLSTSSFTKSLPDWYTPN